MTDELFNEITANVPQYRPVLQKYRDDENALREVTGQLEMLVSGTENYAILLTEYNYDKPRFNILTRSVLKPGVDLNAMIDAFSMAFNLDNASGNQLDVIGLLVGLKRELDYAPSSGGREMDDDEYRLALKLTIAKNTWDGTLGSLGQIYRDILGSEATITYVDNQDMTVDIDVYGDVSTREVEMLNRAGLLIVPSGVEKAVNTIGGNADVDIKMEVAIIGVEWIDGNVLAEMEE